MLQVRTSSRASSDSDLCAASVFIWAAAPLNVWFRGQRAQTIGHGADLPWLIAVPVLFFASTNLFQSGHADLFKDSYLAPEIQLDNLLREREMVPSI